MLLALALQAAVPQTAVEAERAFDRAAQRKGQWTAFRAFAAKDAVMFVPEQVNAQAWLKDRRDPPRPVRWQPTQSYLSCDGKVAVNTGNWQRPDGSIGYFTTLWQRQADGTWKWTMDHGDTLARPRPAAPRPKVRRATCKAKAPEIAFDTCRGRWDRCRAEQSRDRSLTWHWRVEADGERHFDARIWNGRTFETVIDDNVAAPK
jgi:ketosteroid isomerase-like protein